MHGISKHIVHWFTPHHTNNHRAKVLHIDSLSVLTGVLVFVMALLRIASRQMPDVLGYATDMRVDDLVKYTNQERVARGLTPLTVNTQLSAAAAQKAKDMFADNYWAHNSPKGKTPWVFVQASGYQYSLAGENLAKNFNDSKGVVAAWMASPSHKENLVKPDYRDIGFAIMNGTLNGEETTLVVQMFGTTPEQLSAIQNTPRQPVEVATKPVLNDAEPQVAPAYTSITRAPLVNLPKATRDIALIVIGVLGAVLVFDAWVVYRKRLVRATGHTYAHIFFLALMLFMMQQAFIGSIL